MRLAEPATESATDAASNAAPIRGLALRFNRRWRQLASALSFLLFGLTALLLSVLALPVLFITVRDPLARQRRVRVLIRAGMRSFWAWMRGLGLFTCTVRGIQHLRAPRQIVIANHPTLIDAILLLSLIDDAVCIAKQGLAGNRFVGHLLRAAGYIVNDSGPTMVDAARASLAQGARLLIFPESTRTVPGAPIRLRRGAAQVAARTGSAVVTVTIRVSEPLLHKGTSWHDMPLAVPHFDVEVQPPIDVTQIVSASRNPALAARALNERLQKRYE